MHKSSIQWGPIIKNFMSLVNLIEKIKIFKLIFKIFSIEKYIWFKLLKLKF